MGQTGPGAVTLEGLQPFSNDGGGPTKPRISSEALMHDEPDRARRDLRQGPNADEFRMEVREVHGTDDEAERRLGGMGEGHVGVGAKHDPRVRRMEREEARLGTL